MAKRDWRKKKKTKSDFQWGLFGLVSFLTLFGLLMVYNASVVEAYNVFGDKYHYLKNQSMWALMGFILMLLISKVNYNVFKKIAAPFFFINLLLLAAVLIPGLGTSIKGARRWLDLGFFVLQPSELVKLSFTIYLASWLSKERKMLYFLFLIGLLSGLIVLEPDMGTLVVILSNAFLLYFLSGTPLLLLLPLGLIAILGGSLMILSSPYRKTRLLTFLNPTRDPLGSSYHIRQVLIALGSGGILGLGLGQSRQKYEYLPEVTTDSIFAIIAEELGFFGAALVVFVFLIIVLKGIQIARNAPDKFSKLLAAGISGWIGIQVLVNLGAMVALIPLTGLPLPFISYGGSSLVVVLSGVGVLLSIGKHPHNVKKLR
ncbi:putative lipid II flippase FtsW [Candidatus Beckwithbacteria bacterium CG10_big_fil_rev_8_21_14_0_10_34_10]|uniref:Probable peptidoglycan glycosyltransferase FtsW n=1 Tax=Candidatus Beckwithbacteria bacterium CG10_big_fil_rev_8_21_14_0_10_34_10 TaxID=1974495 RepID=A0A2H0WB71_9BACT|nr:MAG: putative lipid II flippase FtsW [Candidatus Beckwithbacteria bacterium CG10_big_fil_rev_8_21_14_0_10_34_10]